MITNNVQLWRGKPGAPAGRQWTSGFAEAVDIARPCNPQWPGGGSHSPDCGDAPSLFFDERVQQYCILTMFGHRLPHNRHNGTRGFGLAYQSCSANITGGFVMGKAPWLELDGLVQLHGLPGPVRKTPLLLLLLLQFADALVRQTPDHHSAIYETL